MLKSYVPPLSRQITPKDDEMNPKFKEWSEYNFNLTHLSVSKDEMSPNLEASSEYKSIPAPLSVPEMLNSLPPDDSDLEIIHAPADK
ncbi:hypothetical protein TNIN_166501 [Trichonephila inaurata madagascariensis]|uniref:Uncharacterized protein n=1 Tax=Trichonephila inaurata madagascariensis TaxID=2747483 RepID=A0A8X6YDQ3_9ARAC|nr:hypothetical protein TNIN_166501 [Trichonephila inaurata madagascariensis]